MLYYIQKGCDDVKSTDWVYDFPSLPHWDNRNVMMVYDEFYEIPQTDTLCCIYSVVEASMMNYLGLLAILKNKEHPQLYYNLPSGINFRDRVSVSPQGDLIFLKGVCRYKNTPKQVYPVIIIDVVKGMFAYVWDDSYPVAFYDVVEIQEGVFGFVPDESQKDDPRLQKFVKTVIEIKKLKWLPLDKLSEFPLQIH